VSRAELYAVLMSLPADTLLLPNAAVAEVVSAERLEKPAAGAPPWLAGTITYRDRKLPAVRFEVLNGAAPVADTRRTRIAIVHGITDRLRAGQYAMVCQGHPHLVTLNRTALRHEAPVAGDRPELVLARVGIANTSALIPDLEALEQTLAQLENPAA
jgi:chemosensory pili system protein ChpC